MTPTNRSARARVQAHTRRVNGRTVRVRAHSRRVDWTPVGREAVGAGVATLAAVTALATLLQTVLSLTTAILTAVATGLVGLAGWRQRHRAARRVRTSLARRGRRRATRHGRRGRHQSRPSTRGDSLNGWRVQGGWTHLRQAARHPVAHTWTVRSTRDDHPTAPRPSVRGARTTPQSRTPQPSGATESPASRRLRHPWGDGPRPGGRTSS